MSVEFSHLDTKDTETTESFFFQNYMGTRLAEDVPSNEGYDPILEESRSKEWLADHWRQLRENDMQYEEDVNQYLILTLAGLANPECLARINDCMVSLDSDVGQQAVGERESTRRYQLFKINADFLLLYLGLLGSGPNASGDAYFDKGQCYYFSAATNLKGIKGGRSALSDVLEKLASRFSRYVNILRLMKNRSENYFSFYSRISQDSLDRLGADLTRQLHGPGNA